ncbi:hypothetical protein VTN02DRAFT_2455 [Thermoascus thermophilus]
MMCLKEKAATFEQMVIDLSTPGHRTYGKHMKLQEIKDFLRPRFEVSQSVLSWLSSEGVPEGSIENDGDWIKFVVPVEQAERILKTRFYYFHDDVSKVTSIRTLEYSVPKGIHPYIQLIQPTTHFGRFSSQGSFILEKTRVAAADSRGTDCNTTITPDCLRQLYKLGDFVATPHPHNKLGISGYLEQYARYNDFQAFLQKYEPDKADANFTVESINGGLNQQNSTKDGTEASLDLQYGVSLSYKVAATYYTTPGRGPLVPDLDQPDPDDSSNEPYLEQLHFLLNLPDEELPLFAQLGDRGVSVIFSSGDSGAGTSCMTNDGKNTTRFTPIFPAACPFVTSVGGTYQINPERAVSFSSGGFSERFPRPSYQAEAVSNYLTQLGDRWKGLFNPDGRGFPDVAAQALNYAVIEHGRLLTVGGTSASAPTFAAIVANLNSVRLAANKTRLGFLNPWLYGLNQTGFTDIVHGGSKGCQGRAYSSQLSPYVPYAGWNATAGWDPVTGLGTPVFSVLAKIVESE